MKDEQQQIEKHGRVVEACGESGRDILVEVAEAAHGVGIDPDQLLWLIEAYTDPGYLFDLDFDALEATADYSKIARILANLDMVIFRKRFCEEERRYYATLLNNQVQRFFVDFGYEALHCTTVAPYFELRLLHKTRHAAKLITTVQSLPQRELEQQRMYDEWAAGRHPRYRFGCERLSYQIPRLMRDLEALREMYRIYIYQRTLHWIELEEQGVSRPSRQPPYFERLEVEERQSQLTFWQ